MKKDYGKKIEVRVNKVRDCAFFSTFLAGNSFKKIFSPKNKPT